MKKFGLALIAVVALGGFGFAGSNDTADDSVHNHSLMYFANSNDDGHDAVSLENIFMAESSDSAGDAV